MSRYHPASPSYHRTLFNNANHEPVSLTTAALAVGGGLLAGKAAGSLMGGSKAPALPAPAAPAAVPTVDSATQAVQQNQQQDQIQNQKKGALSTLLQTGNTQTGAQLGAPAPESSLKRLLGS